MNDRVIGARLLALEARQLSELSPTARARGQMRLCLRALHVAKSRLEESSECLVVETLCGGHLHVAHASADRNTRPQFPEARAASERLTVVVISGRMAP